MCSQCLEVGNWTKCLTCRAVYFCSEECADEEAHQRVCRPIPENACVVCWRGGCTSKCGGCEKVRYCSNECRNQDWQSHKTKCQEWKHEQLPEKKKEGGK